MGVSGKWDLGFQVSRFPGFYWFLLVFEVQKPVETKMQVYWWPNIRHSIFSWCHWQITQFCTTTFMVFSVLVTACSQPVLHTGIGLARLLKVGYRFMEYIMRRARDMNPWIIDRIRFSNCSILITYHNITNVGDIPHSLPFLPCTYCVCFKFRILS